MKESFAQAISAAISEEMRRDDTVLVYGEDVAEMGGIFCATKRSLAPSAASAPPFPRAPLWAAPSARP